MKSNWGVPTDSASDRAQRAHRPLEGVRVLEVGTFAFVPAAARVLAEWGATVIKIETGASVAAANRIIMPPSSLRTRQEGQEAMQMEKQKAAQ